MTNVVGTLNVLIAARDAKVRRVIYSGSSSVYGDQAVMPLVETMTPNPLNPYALQKYVGEQYTRMFHRLFAMETLTLRYFNVYGPRMASEGAYVTVISAFMAARRRGEPLPIHGDGEQTRDFTHVSDIVSANILAMDAPVADGRAINVGAGRNVSINRIADLIGGQRVQLETRKGDMRNTLADTIRGRAHPRMASARYGRGRGQTTPSGGGFRLIAREVFVASGAILNSRKSCKSVAAPKKRKGIGGYSFV